MRPRPFVALVLLAALALTGAGPRREAGSIVHGDPGWASSPLWDDGRAEFSTYAGTTLRYGQVRSTTARIILVKEDLVRATGVKSEAGPVPGATMEALKHIFVADFPTGTYAYHQMASLFYARATLELVKETMTHSESCGMTYVSIRADGDRLTHHAHSYWDGEGDRQTSIAWPKPERPRVHWDALPVWLRSLPRPARGGGAMDVWLLPTQISGHAPLAATRPVSARIRMASQRETVRVPAGALSAIRYTVETAAGRDTFWLAAATPHPLVRMATAAGRRLELTRTFRLDYWNHRDNGDERLLSP